MDKELLAKQYFLGDTTKYSLKILVSYIKPSFLFKSDVLTPIHLGRAVAKQSSKDGVISDEDLKWLCTNCLGDDDFEGNISKYNRRVGFLTGTYWAWKNYGKLGKPKYFGSFGYRKLLAPDFLNDLQQYDAILPKKVDFKIEPLRDQFINYHGADLYSSTINIITDVYPTEVNAIESYFNGTSGYFHELYILREELFFDFCNWIFPLLLAFLQTQKIMSLQNDKRDIAFVMERLTGYYLNKLTSSYAYKEVDVIMTQKPVVNKQNINKDILARLRRKK